jgi:DhnA family fructose-bisphosphate aldolase class Ia
LADYGKRIRLNRLLRPDRSALVVAFDHAMILGPIPGMVDPAIQVRRFLEAKADAILLNLGSIRYFADALVPGQLTGLIARLDWTTALSQTAKTSAQAFQTCLVAHPTDALQSGADAVITFLIVGSGDPVFEKKEVRRVGKLARECERIGVPLMVESLARGPQVHNPCDPKWILLHTRIAAELGADVVKTESTGDAKTMGEVVAACPIPILVLGGSRTGSDDEVVGVVRNIVQSGAAGVFFGRNIFQADNMAGLLQRVREVLAGQGPAQGT